MLANWVVVVSGRRMVEEFRKRPDEELSHVLNAREVSVVLPLPILTAIGTYKAHALARTRSVVARFYRPRIPSSRSSWRTSTQDDSSRSASRRGGSPTPSWRSQTRWPLPSGNTSQSKPTVGPRSFQCSACGHARRWADVRTLQSGRACWSSPRCGASSPARATGRSLDCQCVRHTTHA